MKNSFKNGSGALDWFKVSVGAGAFLIPLAITVAGTVLTLKINYAVSQGKEEVKKELEEYVDVSLTTKAPWTKNEKYVLETIEDTKDNVGNNGKKIDSVQHRVSQVERTVDKIDNKLDYIIKKTEL